MLSLGKELKKIFVILCFFVNTKIQVWASMAIWASFGETNLKVFSTLSPFFEQIFLQGLGEGEA